MMYRYARLGVPTLAVALALAATAGAQAKGGSQAKASLAAQDLTFVRHAAQGGQAEVALGKLATAKASAPAVKSFGRRMVLDHGKAGKELSSLAASKGVKAPAKPGPEEQQELSRLSRLSGAAFDRAYASLMVSDHKKDVSEFAKASTSLKDPELKSWATKTLPTLRQHLSMAESLASGGKAMAGPSHASAGSKVPLKRKG